MSVCPSRCQSRLKTFSRHPQQPHGPERPEASRAGHPGCSLQPVSQYSLQSGNNSRKHLVRALQNADSDGAGVARYHPLPNGPECAYPKAKIKGKIAYLECFMSWVNTSDFFTSEYYSFSVHLHVSSLPEVRLSRTLQGRALSGTGGRRMVLCFPWASKIAAFRAENFPERLLLARHRGHRRHGLTPGCQICCNPCISR